MRNFSIVLSRALRLRRGAELNLTSIIKKGPSAVMSHNYIFGRAIARELRLKKLVEQVGSRQPLTLYNNNSHSDYAHTNDYIYTL